MDSSDNARTPAQDLATLAHEIEHLRDALVQLSLALHDFQFTAETPEHKAACAAVDALVDRAKKPVQPL